MLPVLLACCVLGILLDLAVVRPLLRAFGLYPA